MKKRVKSQIIIGIIILAIVILLLLPSKAPAETSEEIAKCIGEKSTLYVQLGCSHCEDQEELFGENIKYLNKIDCFYETEKCADIVGTPTWEIKNNLYTGVQSIDKLKELTNC